MSIIVKLKKSISPKHKYTAYFYKNGKVFKVVSFGASGYKDFTIYSRQNNKELAEEKKANYLARHRPNENWNDPYSHGALSRWILWNKPTIKASFIDYSIRFGFIPPL